MKFNIYYNKVNRRENMCNCFEKTKEKIIDKIISKAPDHTEFSGDWENKVFFFGDNPPCVPVVVPFKYSLRQIKTNGEPYRNMTSDVMNVTMSFCPFCGQKTTED
jgi:hypothetical protein